MTRYALLIALAPLVFASEKSAAEPGATAPYNEAVRIEGGRRVVEVLPFPSHMNSAVKFFKTPEQDRPHTAPVVVIETPDGLQDCIGTSWYHPKACSPSSFGKEKRLRTWLVKRDGKWFGCTNQMKPASCVPIVVDGKLRALPMAKE